MLNVAREHITTGAELELTLRALIPHIVALVRALEFNFAGGGERESLRRGFLGFLFRHGLPSSPKPAASELAVFFKALDTDRVPAGVGPTAATARRSVEPLVRPLRRV